jgi:dTDP-4-amino-4,6-dideoxygalactose transaminase
LKFLDLTRLHRSIRAELQSAIDDVLERSAFIGGDAVRRFEDAFGDAHGAPAGAGCASGTDALTLALRALGVGSGDEVIVPSMTFVATAEAVAHVGATPVVADVDPRTLLLTPQAVAARRTERTRAVIAVHLYGHVVPFDALSEWRRSGLLVIEDAAQAHLASWQGQPIGSVGHAACFSFFPGKNLGAFGDGGMVLSRDVSLVEEVRRLRDHGRRSKYAHDVVGWCSRLDALQAAVLNVKLAHLAEWTEGRRSVAERYRAALGDTLVPWEDGAVHHLLVARFDDRDAVQEHLGAAGVETGVHYPIPLALQPWLVPGGWSTPAAEAAANEVLSLPLDPLMVAEEVDYVCRALETQPIRA